MRALKSVEEAAGLLGISPWTVRSYIKTGKLKPVRLGRRVLVEGSGTGAIRGRVPRPRQDTGDNRCCDKQD
jgi:excisionase family DNA binding protein